ncbi:hypothetical protein HaLaN_04390, partial [Haematococcus lacustris]
MAADLLAYRQAAKPHKATAGLRRQGTVRGRNLMGRASTRALGGDSAALLSRQHSMASTRRESEDASRPRDWLGIDGQRVLEAGLLVPDGHDVPDDASDATHDARLLSLKDAMGGEEGEGE